MSASANPIRIGIVGAGGIVRSRHVPGFNALDGVEITAVCNSSEKSTAAAAKEFGIRHRFSNWQELVQSDLVDAVVIGTWPYLHCPITLAAFDAGKHVLCQARMAMNASEAAAMLDAAKSHPELTAQIVPSPFTLAVEDYVRKLIDDGELGALLAVRFRDGASFVDSGRAPTWREDRTLSGLNCMTLGIWYESLMRWLGSARRVQALANTFVPQRVDASGESKTMQIPDHLSVAYETEAGTLVQMQVSQVTGLAGPPDLWIHGETGTLRLLEGRLFHGGASSTALEEIEVPDEQQGRWRVEEEFIDAIRGVGSITRTTFEDGLRYMQFTEAVAESIETGNTVVL